MSLPMKVTWIKIHVTFITRLDMNFMTWQTRTWTLNTFNPMHVFLHYFSFMLTYSCDDAFKDLCCNIYNVTDYNGCLFTIVAVSAATEEKLAEPWRPNLAHNRKRWQELAGIEGMMVHFYD